MITHAVLSVLDVVRDGAGASRVIRNPLVRFLNRLRHVILLPLLMVEVIVVVMSLLSVVIVDHMILVVLGLLLTILVLVLLTILVLVLLSILGLRFRDRDCNLILTTLVLEAVAIC